MQQGECAVARLLLGIRVGRQMLSASPRTVCRKWLRFVLSPALADKREALVIILEQARGCRSRIYLFILEMNVRLGVDWADDQATASHASSKSQTRYAEKSEK